MSRYDNWERLVAAVVKKEQLWQLFHAQSRSPSISSESSGFSFSFELPSLADDESFSFFSLDRSASDRKEDYNGGVETAAATPSSTLVKNQSSIGNLSPNKRSTSDTPARKRDLRIQVPKPLLQHYGAFSPKTPSPVHLSKTHSKALEGHSESPANWPVDVKQQSHPLPLPPEAFSNSSPFSCPNSATTSPNGPLYSPERAESWKSPVTIWKRGKLLSRGAFGNIYLGFNSEKGKMCAMKEFNLYSDGAQSNQSAMFGIDIAPLCTLKHPNILQYYGSEMVDGNFYIYYEYVSGGCISKILSEYGKLGESAIRIYTKQILLGLAYLHSKNITHGDIRGDTILLDPNGVVKLCNSIERQIVMQCWQSPVIDGAYWMAPEVIMNPNTRNRAMDVWSLGCTIIEMATSKPPLGQYKKGGAMYKVAYHKELPSVPDNLSDEGKDFLRHCLQWDPVHRATASQLLEHPFVKNWSPLTKRVRVPTFTGFPTDTVPAMQRASNSNLHPSDIYSPRKNISAPVSLIGSPLIHPRSPQIPNSQKSPQIPNSQKSPQIPHLNRPLLPPQTFRDLPKHSPYTSVTAYWDPDITRKVKDSRENKLGRAGSEQVKEQLVMVNRVFQQLVRASMMSHHVD